MDSSTRLDVSALGQADADLSPVKECCDQLSVFFDASDAEKPVVNVDRPKRVFRDTLFEDGRVLEEDSDDKTEPDAGIELGQSGVQTSWDLRRCNQILQSIQKESEEVLHFAFHDTMISRRKWSGMNWISFQKMLLKSWKAYVDDQKILKLRSDLGLKKFCDFLSGLSDAEKEMVFPLIREAQEKILDCRIRQKEIRVEKSFTFRKFLAEEPSITKRRALLDDWLAVTDFVHGTPDDDCYGFLRRFIDFGQDSYLQTFLKKKVKETARLAGKWIRGGCRSFAWIKSDGCHGFYSQPMLDEIWTSCTFGKHDDFGTQFWFFLTPCISLKVATMNLDFLKAMNPFWISKGYGYR